MALANRPSIRLNAYQVERARDAAAHAERIGKPFTHQLTTYWEKTDGADTVQTKQGRLLICARHWLERRNESLVCVWSVEPNKHGEGAHTHTLLSLPTRRRNMVRDLSERLPGWTNTEPLDKKTAQWGKGKMPRGTVACGGYPDLPWSPIWCLQRRYDNSPRLISYVLKYGQDNNRGNVVGKRLGMSNNLGPAAIKAWELNLGTDEWSTMEGVTPLP